MAGSEYYDHTTYPSNGAAGSSAAMRAELDAIEQGFDKLPALAGNGSKPVRVNALGTALEAVASLPATVISNTPSGNLAATDVQGALNELQSDIDTRATSAALTSHTGAAAGAHAASAISNTPSGNLAATTVQGALNELQTDIDGRQPLDATLTSLAGGVIGEELTNTATSALQVPVGTTAQRPTGADGKIRYNDDLNRYEGYDSTQGDWGRLGGGATGGGSDAIFHENDQTVNNDYTITTNKNAMSAGPITIANTKTVTVPNGSVWTIV